MGVYIPNMEKPKSCEECRFRTCFIKVNLKKYTCWLNGEECGKTDCPLIEIDDEAIDIAEDIIDGCKRFKERRADDKTEESRP